MIKIKDPGYHNHERLTWNDAKTKAYWDKVRGKPKSKIK